MNTETLIKLKLANHEFVKNMSWFDILSTDIITWGIGIVAVIGLFSYIGVKKYLWYKKINSSRRR